MMLRIALSTSQSSIRNFSSKSEPIPKELGKTLSSLFRQSKYDQVIETIESSPYKNTTPMMKLLAEAHQFLKIEHEDSCERILNQIKYMENNSREK